MLLEFRVTPYILNTNANTTPRVNAKPSTLCSLPVLTQTLNPKPKPSPELCSNATGSQQVHPRPMLINRQPRFSAVSLGLKTQTLGFQP